MLVYYAKLNGLTCGKKNKNGGVKGKVSMQRIEVCVFAVVCMHHTSGIVLSGFVYATVMMMELSLCNVGKVCAQLAGFCCLRARALVHGRAPFCG